MITTDLFGAALREHRHGFPAEHAPICDGTWTEAIFLLDMAGRFAAHVIWDEWKFRRRWDYCAGTSTLNPSGILGCTDHVISRPQVLHCTLLRSRPTSFRNCIAKPLSQKRYVRKSLFGPPSCSDMRRPYEGLGMKGISCRRFSCSLATSHSFSTIFCWNKRTGTAHNCCSAKNACYSGTGGV